MGKDMETVAAIYLIPEPEGRRRTCCLASKPWTLFWMQGSTAVSAPLSLSPKPQSAVHIAATQLGIPNTNHSAPPKQKKHKQ